MKKIAILQSNYIPWKGYFDLIASVDEFILLDDVQFTKNDWRNRNIIKTNQGLKWLTIPVGKDINRLTMNVEISDRNWQRKHWASIHHAYNRSLYYEEISFLLKPLYLECHHLKLSELNRLFIEIICDYLDIETKITTSQDYEFFSGQTTRLISLCQQAGACEYISGPAAKDYLDEGLFTNAGIEVKWFEYGDYPEYRQLWGNFNHNVSIIDLLFNAGKNAALYMKYVK
jgi:hypothetical protein